jgi:DNA-binding GntR family transcriptional regulator
MTNSHFETCDDVDHGDVLGKTEDLGCPNIMVCHNTIHTSASQLMQAGLENYRPAGRNRLTIGSQSWEKGLVVIKSDQLKQALAVARPVGNLRTQVVAKLRGAIVDGHFPPGIRLIERELCELLGVSRTLIREALRQLEAEGWVENVPYRGPTVAATSADEARQLYEIRAVLEGWAAQRCAENATDEDRTELSELVEQLAAAERQGDLKQMMEILDGFHEKLLQSAGNQMLTTYLESLRSRLRRLRAVSLRQPGRARQTIEEKRILLEAIKQRDGKKARKAREQHVLNAARNVTAALVEQPSHVPNEAPAKNTR